MKNSSFGVKDSDYFDLLLFTTDYRDPRTELSEFWFLDRDSEENFVLSKAQLIAFEFGGLLNDLVLL